MNLTCIFLVFTVISCFIVRNKIITISLAFTSAATALFYGMIDSYGLISIIVFYLITALYSQKSRLSNPIKFLLMVAILLATTCFALHLIPGFYNMLVLDKIFVSKISTPFSMYLNFDKTIAGVILFMNSSLYNNEKLPDRESIITTSVLVFLCSFTLMNLGFFSGYIKFDLKFPDILFIWCINNLFFVCLAEEVIFRGIVQNKLTQLLSNKYLALILASLIFGLMHFKGGIAHMSLAAVAGVFYGFAYQKTGRILCAMLVHFGLNLIHMIFFTYPAAIKIMG